VTCCGTPAANRLLAGEFLEAMGFDRRLQWVLRLPYLERIRIGSGPSDVLKAIRTRQQLFQMFCALSEENRCALGAVMMRLVAIPDRQPRHT